MNELLKKIISSDEKAADAMIQAFSDIEADKSASEKADNLRDNFSGAY